MVVKRRRKQTQNWKRAPKAFGLRGEKRREEKKQRKSGAETAKKSRIKQTEPKGCEKILKNGTGEHAGGGRLDRGKVGTGGGYNLGSLYQLGLGSLGGSC